MSWDPTPERDCFYAAIEGRVDDFRSSFQSLSWRQKATWKCDEAGARGWSIYGAAARGLNSGPGFSKRAPSGGSQEDQVWYFIVNQNNREELMLYPDKLDRARMIAEECGNEAAVHYIDAVSHAHAHQASSTSRAEMVDSRPLLATA
tara:strand:- start:685 stop:1125 length:441 start_codon:yes stop_codon:yes gene_type:complete